MNLTLAIADLSYDQLQHELEARGLSSEGARSTLIEKLFRTLRATEHRDTNQTMLGEVNPRIEVPVADAAPQNYNVAFPGPYHQFRLIIVELRDRWMILALVRYLVKRGICYRKSKSCWSVGLRI